MKKILILLISRVSLMVFGVALVCKNMRKNCLKKFKNFQNWIFAKKELRCFYRARIFTTRTTMLCYGTQFNFCMKKTHFSNEIFFCISSKAIRGNVYKTAIAAAWYFLHFHIHTRHESKLNEKALMFLFFNPDTHCLALHAHMILDD